MDAVKVFNHPVFGQVRVIDDNASGELLFCANDVTHALEYANGRKAVADHVDSRDILKRDMGVITGKKADGTYAYQTVITTFINESGVYSLIFSITLPDHSSLLSRRVLNIIRHCTPQ